MSKVRCWKLLLTGEHAGLAFAPLHDCSIHPAHYERVLVVEASALNALRARVAELGAALEWYREQHAGSFKVGRVGDPCRQALDADGGEIARKALWPQDA